LELLRGLGVTAGSVRAIPGGVGAREVVVRHFDLRALADLQREIGVLLPNNQRQHHTLHIQKDVLPYALS